jgi:hypothetical protein
MRILPQPKRKIVVPRGSSLTEQDYVSFLQHAYREFSSDEYAFLAPDEGIDNIELAHLIPSVPETLIAIYLGINDAPCNKALVSPFLVRHGHNNVFVFDPDVYSGGDDVPDGTIDAKAAIRGFKPPNRTWHREWTYVMIADPSRTPESLWKESGYIDMIAAKFEDFTMLTGSLINSKLCIFIDPAAFDHPVNKQRPYLREARKRGEKTAHEYIIPKGLEGETDGLVPVVLQRGEKLYVATTDFRPCEHAWSNLHPPDNSQRYAVVEENSAVPLDLVTNKPKPRYGGLKQALGSADSTTDWFFRGMQVYRKPLLAGTFKG